MAAFFAIAGFLAAQTLRHRSADKWIVARSWKIAIPAIVGIAVISPIIWAMLTFVLPAEKVASVLPFEWHHLWFLFALLIYQAIAYTVTIGFSSRSITLSLIWLRRMGQVKVLFVLTSLTLVLTLVTMILVLFFSPISLQPMLLETRLIAAYVPLYLFGMALGSSRSLRSSLLTEIRIPVFVVATIACIYVTWRLGFRARLPSDAAASGEAQIRVLIGALCPPAAVLLVMRSALSIRHSSPWVYQLCDASFTIYVVHYPLILGANLISIYFDSLPLLEYGIEVLAVGITSYGFHMLIVRRSNLIALLLNGRISKRSNVRM